MPSVKIKTYEEARNITCEYVETEPYLRSLIRNHVPDAEIILSCSDFSNLKYHGRVILGVAKKILRTSVKKETESAILENISKLSNCTELSKRELLEERICLQIEGCNVPYWYNLIKEYNRVKGVIYSQRL